MSLELSNEAEYLCIAYELNLIDIQYIHSWALDYLEKKEYHDQIFILSSLQRKDLILDVLFSLKEGSSREIASSKAIALLKVKYETKQLSLKDVLSLMEKLYLNGYYPSGEAASSMSLWGDTDYFMSKGIVDRKDVEKDIDDFFKEHG